tara:strand:- start:305 stop:406 length:102 start_codon:yes stop_codon:yes gene_type:complete
MRREVEDEEVEDVLDVGRMSCKRKKLFVFNVCV